MAFLVQALVFARRVLVYGAWSCRRRSKCGQPANTEERPLQRQAWLDTGLVQLEVVVRSMAGELVCEPELVSFETPVSKIVSGICSRVGVRADMVQLCLGGAILNHHAWFGDYVRPPLQADSKLELLYVRVMGAAITATAMSERSIRVLDTLPVVGSKCHLDRDYRFTSLGGFANEPNMFYILTSNDDKITSARNVMWRLDVRRPHATVFLNFRSLQHAMVNGVADWLRRDGWNAPKTMIASTVSTGIPNGPYRGPVYSKAVTDGIVDLMGSGCAEGTYFVFVQIDDDVPST